MTDDNFRSCGSRAAHRPHGHWWKDQWWRCRGVMPIWPCERVFTDEHDDHLIYTETSYFCPGVDEPPTDMTGPPYPDTELDTP